MNLGHPVSPLARRILGPVGWPTKWLFLAAGMYVVWRSLIPAFYYMEWAWYAMIALAAIPGVMLIRILMREWTASALEQPIPSPMWRDWRGVFVIILGTMLLVTSKLPMRLGFELARPQIERMVEQIRAGAAKSSFEGRSAGIYTIRHIMVSPDTIRFSFTANGDGFAYVADGARYLSLNRGSDGHLAKNWYWYACD